MWFCRNISCCMMIKDYLFSFRHCPRVNHCCCLPLTPASIFIAFLDIIASIIFLVSISNTLDLLLLQEDYLPSGSYKAAFFYTEVLLMCQIIAMFMSTLLIIGICMGKSLLVYPWLIWTMCAIAIYGVLIIATTFIEMSQPEANLSTPSIILPLIYTVYRIYCMIIVGNYYNTIYYTNYNEKLLKDGDAVEEQTKFRHIAYMS